MISIQEDRSRRNVFWLSILLLLVVEFALFRHYIIKEVVNYFPTNFDQSGYLAIAYEFYFQVMHGGFQAALQHNTLTLPTSFIFIPQTILYFLVFGASRASALSLNFLYFALLQVFLVKTTWEITGRRAYAYIILGLLLLTPTTFFWAGGILDYRIDFMVFCLYGILMTCIIQSRVFFNRKWSLIAAGISIYLMLLRYITAAYIFGIIVATFCYLVFILWRRVKLHQSIDPIKTRLINMIIYGFALLIGTLPFLWNQKSDIYNYYVVNHFLNGEKYIRSLQLGVTNLFTNIIYYPKSILLDHFGLETFGIVAALIFLAYIINRKILSKVKQDDALTSVIYFLIFAIAVPIVALTSDLSKSPVVGGITVVPLLWLSLCLLFVICQQDAAGRRNKVFVTLLAFLILPLGIANYVKHFTDYSSRAQKQNLMQINNMYFNIGDYMQDKSVNMIRYSVDQVIDFLVPTSMETVYYEQKKIPLHAAFVMGGNINDLSEDDAKKNLGQSDVFIMNLNPYPDYLGNYPFNIAMNTLRPKLLETLNKEFKVLGDYPYNGYLLRVYVRPNPQNG